MMKTIVLPTDFSENARNAIEYAVQMFGKEGCDFFLFNAVEVLTSSAGVPDSTVDQRTRDANELMNKLVKELQQLLEDTPSVVRSSVQLGNGISDMVDRVAGEEGANLIIMGTQGASGLTEVLIGTHTEALIRKTRLPVLAVPESAWFKPPKRILFAADLQQMNDSGVLGPLKEIARKYDSKITILTVENEQATSDEEGLREDLHLHREFDDIEHAYDVAQGNRPHDQIECYIAANGTDLLVTISRHGGFWDRIFHTSVTGKLAMHTTVPMLALHDHK